MRKNKLLISTLLPVAAFVSVVGAGYSAWYFQSEANAETTASVTVTPVAVGGGITVTTSEHGLTLDQEDETHNSNPTGITWKDIGVKYTADTSDGAAEGTGTITWTLSLPETFKDYVNVTESGTWNITNLSADQEFTLNNDTLGLSYVSEPNNYSEWEAMNTALSGKTITVTFVAEYDYSLQ